MTLFDVSFHFLLPFYACVIKLGGKIDFFLPNSTVSMLRSYSLSEADLLCVFDFTAVPESGVEKWINRSNSNVIWLLLSSFLLKDLHIR